MQRTLKRELKVLETGEGEGLSVDTRGEIPGFNFSIKGGFNSLFNRDFFPGSFLLSSQPSIFEL